jgi:methionyl-tRNA formyltransferase
MRIVYCGSGEFGIPCLDTLQASEHRIVHVFIQPAHPAGRGRHPRPTAVASWATAHEVPFTETTDINSPFSIEQIWALGCDMMLAIAFGQKICNELIAMPPKGAINVHASLLPRYRGAAPINWAIIEGQARTGVSVITLASKMDGGQILGQERTAIGRNETAGELHDRLAKLAVPLLMRVIDELEKGTAVYKTQNAARVSRAPKLRKSDGYIDWGQPADTLRNKIRGLWPWPGAQAIYVSRKNGKCARVTIAAAEIAEQAGDQSLVPGMIDENLNVICGDKALRIIELKPAGGGLMDFQSFANGRETGKGDLFMPIDEIPTHEP